MRWFLNILRAAVLPLLAWACEPIPPLHLHEEPTVVTELGLDVVWSYSPDTLGTSEDSLYHGWGNVDTTFFGNDYAYAPLDNSFEVRRFFLGQQQDASHTQVNSNFLDNTNQLVASYQFGYYDILAWNYIKGEDGMQSVVIDESSSLDDVRAYTNRTKFTRRHRQAGSSSASLASKETYYQPEELFCCMMRNVWISSDYNDYDDYDPEKRVYYMHLSDTLQPVVYIYLPRVILRHNKGRVTGTSGNACLTGMAHSTSLCRATSGSDDVSVYFNTMFKNRMKYQEEDVDIIGGRLTTFGICNANPYKMTSRTQAEAADPYPHMLEINLKFSNGTDSTVVFDVTRQIQEHFRGGAITVELDVDTVPIPKRPGGEGGGGSGSGGGGFGAAVQDYEHQTYEYEI